MRLSWQTLPVAALLAVASVVPGACADPGPPAGRDSTFTGAAYLLEWAASGAAIRGDGTIRLTNDLGYEIILERGLLTTYAVSLAECPTLMSQLRRVLGPAIARAGHGEALDPSTVAGVVERLGEAPQRLGPIAFPAKRYCRAHWISAPADASTAGAEEAGMTGAAMVLEGTWSEGGETGHFAWRSTLASAALEEFPSLDGTEATVHVVRTLDTLLDGVDFRSATAATASRTLLLNLADQTRLEVEAR